MFEIKEWNYYCAFRLNFQRLIRNVNHSARLIDTNHPRWFQISTID